jgi:hypothetical protein
MTIEAKRITRLMLVLVTGVLADCSDPMAPAALDPSAPSLGGTPAAYRSTITIDYNQVPNTDQKNFPVLISGTYDGTGGGPDLRTTVNGGKVRSPYGYDVGFYTNPDCSGGKLRWETEKYSAATGEVVYWVKVPTVFNAKNTVLYMCYGTISITSDQSSTDTWDSNYKSVWHMADKGGLDLQNSADANWDLLNSGPVASDLGKIGGGTNKFFDGSYYLDSPTLSFGQGATITVSLWKKLLYEDNFVNAANDWNHITFGMGSVHATKNSMTLWAPYGGDVLAQWYVGEGPGPETSFANYFDRWVYITCVYNSTGKMKSLYLDGNLVASMTGNPTVGTVTGFRLGQFPDGHGQDPSQFDEVRVSKVARTADWIKTEFNNQNDPASFYAMGLETVR